MSDWYAQYVNGAVTRLVKRDEVELVAKRPGVTGTPATALEWSDRDPGVRGGKRRFRIVPITDAQAARWMTAQELGEP